MGILFWIIFGAIAGWLASMIAGTNAQMGFLGNIAVGIVGAVIGGFIGSAIFDTGISGFNFASFALAVGGALILLFGLKAISGKS